MARKSFEFDTLFSDVEQGLEERKNRIKTICFKVCSKCGERKLLFKFSVDTRNLDGRIRVCKKCRSRESLSYYYQNQGRILIQNKEYRKSHERHRSIYFKNYQKEHKKNLKELARKWYLENKEAIKERNLKYYREHEQACLVRRRIWRIKNKEKIREYNREYKLKHKSASLREKIEPSKDIKPEKVRQDL